MDQASKAAVRLYVPYGTEIDLGILDITNIRNTGISFGLFKGLNLLFIVIALAAIAFFISLYKKNHKYRTQFTIIIAGAAGNLVDRIIFGHVVDFIDFRFFPVFNIADTCITFGIAWMLFLILKDNDDLL